MSSRRQRLPDGTHIVWRDERVELYGADGRLAESRPLTSEELVTHRAWQDAQPDGAERRAMREAHAAALAAERAAAEKLTTVRTLPELVAALVAERPTRPKGRSTDA